MVDREPFRKAVAAYGRAWVRPVGRGNNDASGRVLRLGRLCAGGSTKERRLITDQRRSAASVDGGRVDGATGPVALGAG